MSRPLSVCMACLALAACTQSYHPEYHPQSAVSYVQNVTYAHNVTYGAPGEGSAPVAQIDVDLAAPYLLGGSSHASPTTPTAPPDNRPSTVKSPGAVVVYGNLNGNVYLGR